MNLSRNAKNAIFIGSLCSVSYLAVYIARNVLGAVQAQMLDSFDPAFLGDLGAFFFFFYAVGQLINGAIGDKIKARYMISLGLLLAGITNMIFPRVAEIADTPLAAKIVYGLTGFFLAMIYGPMTKVVAENTEPHHATRCSLGYTFASFFGSPLAGVLAAFLAWQTVFRISSIALFVMAVVAFSVFLLLEKKGIVKYGQYAQKKSDKRFGFAETVRLLLRHHFLKFAVIAIITGVIRTSLVQWFTTYFCQKHGYSDDESASIFTVVTLVMCTTAFISVFLFEKVFKSNINHTILAMFSVSAVAFTAVIFVSHPILNIACLILAVMASNGSATMLWSRYCPSLRDTGAVSGATGFLDFLSYMAAAIANIVFSHLRVEGDLLNWRAILTICLGLMLIGVSLSLPYGRFFRKKRKNAQNA